MNSFKSINNYPRKKSSLVSSESGSCTQTLEFNGVFNFFFYKDFNLVFSFLRYIYTQCKNAITKWRYDLLTSYKRKTSSMSKQTPLLILFILRQISYILQLQTNFCRLRPISVCNCTVVKNLLIFTIRYYTWSVSSVGHAHSNKLAIG